MHHVTPPIEPRPQPLGVHPPPAGYLLLPPAPGASTPLSRLLSGHSAVDWPDAWRFYARALEGNVQAAWHALEGDPTPHALYNRFVLRPDAAGLHAIRDRLGGEWEELAGVVAYALGLTDEVPETPALTGELAAFAGASRAAHAIERGDRIAAVSALEAAIEPAREATPVFAAQLLAQCAEVRRQLDPTIARRAVDDLREAIRLAGNTALDRLCAELWLGLGLALQELASGRREPLLEAVKAYQECLRAGVSVEQQGDLYARAHQNLALAYLTMPRAEGSDHLRLGIAVQSLREALKVYGRDTHPELWASTKLNLANALQYLPSSHPEANLVQAIELYEEVFAVRDRALEPVGYARLLADQANALAHLGLFAPALEKLDEAHKLFHWHGEPESAAAVLELVNRIHRCRAGDVAVEVTD